MAAVDQIDFRPVGTSAANAASGAVAAQLATSATSTGSAAAAPAGAQAAATMWAAVPVAATTMLGQAVTVSAAMAWRGVKLTTRNCEAVGAMVAMNEGNRESLTPHPVVSP